MAQSTEKAPTEIPWVEKYRPAKIDDVAQQEEVCRALQTSLQTGELPNLLFYGPPGTGKTTVALALVQQFFGKDWRSRTRELNASDERGISAVREKVKTFAQLAIGQSASQDGLAQSKGNFKVIILDEADSMTHDAQAALRRIMEEFVHVTRFIIICNYVSKIIDPLHSRCSKFRFQLIAPEFQKARLLHISQAEQVKMQPRALDKLLSLSRGDMRAAVTLLQTAQNFYGEVSEEGLVEVACAVPVAAVQELVRLAREGKSTEEVTQGVRNFLAEGYSGQQVMEQLLDMLTRDPSITDLAKARCATLFSQVDERLTQGCDEELQLFHLFAQTRTLVQAR